MSHQDAEQTLAEADRRAGQAERERDASNRALREITEALGAARIAMGIEENLDNRVVIQALYDLKRENDETRARNFSLNLLLRDMYSRINTRGDLSKLVDEIREVVRLAVLAQNGTIRLPNKKATDLDFGPRNYNAGYNKAIDEVRKTMGLCE